MTMAYTDRAISAQIDNLVADLTMIQAQLNGLSGEDPARVTLQSLADRTHRRISWLCDQEQGPDHLYLTQHQGEGRSRAS